MIHIPGLFTPVLPLQVPIQASLLQYSDSELNELATKNFQSKDLPGIQHCRGGVGWSGWAHTDTVGLSGSGNRVRRAPPKAFLQFINPCVLAESFPQKGRCLGCKVSQNTLPGLWADSTCPVQALQQQRSFQDVSLPTASPMAEPPLLRLKARLCLAALMRFMGDQPKHKHQAEVQCIYEILQVCELPWEK